MNARRSEPCLPAARMLEMLPSSQPDGTSCVLLHDRTGIAPETLAASTAGYFILLHLDGHHTTRDVQSAFRREFGEVPSASEIQSFVDVLDQNLMLANQRFERAYFEKRTAYEEHPLRDNRARWNDAPELYAEIRATLSGGVAPASPQLRGIVAPHLDYLRGKPCYADAYAALATAQPAERYVILGTNHFGRSHGVVATGKDFLTPLGPVPTDRDLINRLDRELAISLCADEFDHDREHSIELQVHLLQSLYPGGNFAIVPLLIPDPVALDAEGQPSLTGVPLPDFAAALSAAVAADGRRTLFIASADLSHIGQRFGDEPPTTPDTLIQISNSDQEFIKHCADGNLSAALERVRSTNNVTRICSIGCIFTLLSVLKGYPFRPLRYHQATDFDTDTHVTCMAGVVE